MTDVLDNPRAQSEIPCDLDATAVYRAFVEFSRASDGPLHEGRFEFRDARLAELRVPQWQGDPVDPLEFVYLCQRRTPAVRRRLVRWLVTVAQADTAEAWGVRLRLEKASTRRDESVRAEALHLVDIQETYHGQALDALLLPFNLRRPRTRPPLAMRLIVRSMLIAPRWIADVLACAGELVGTLAFWELRHRATSLLDSDPEVLQYCQSLLDEILTDELGHVALLLASFSRLQRKALHFFCGSLDWALRLGYGAHLSRAVRTGINSYDFAAFPERLRLRSFVGWLGLNGRPEDFFQEAATAASLPD
jgi:hypothetical protein